MAIKRYRLEVLAGITYYTKDDIEANSIDEVIERFEANHYRMEDEFEEVSHNDESFVLGYTVRERVYEDEEAFENDEYEEEDEKWVKLMMD